MPELEWQLITNNLIHLGIAYLFALLMSIINFLTLRYIKRFTEYDGDRSDSDDDERVAQPSTDTWRQAFHTP